ncbi:MAG: SdrD B-like domain-containing protein, partial [Candidatus Krumholzibacteriaceae bacterium]
MAARKLPSISFLVVPILLVLTLAVVFSCSDQPTAVKPEHTSVLSGNGTVNPGTGGSFLLGSVADTVAAPGYIEVWAMNVAFDSATGIVSFDVQLWNKTQRNIAPPIHFVITDIIPADIALVGFDGVAPDGKPFMDFSSKLGSDNLLTPNERTDAVTLKFHTVRARSFAIGFRIELGPPSGSGIIAGVVFRDDNKNGTKDNEPGINGITVALQHTLSGGQMVTLVTRTDSSGAYKFDRLVEGVYDVIVVVSPDRWTVTSTNPLLVTLVKGPDGLIKGFLEANFGLYPAQPPPPVNLFGPIRIGPPTPHGTLLDSTFVNPPSPLAVVYHYYIGVREPPLMTAFRAVVDSASAWVNDVLVFTYHRSKPPDTLYAS